MNLNLKAFSNILAQFAAQRAEVQQGQGEQIPVVLRLPYLWCTDLFCRLPFTELAAMQTRASSERICCHLSAVLQFSQNV